MHPDSASPRARRATTVFAASVTFTALAALPAFADDDALRREIDAMKARMAEMEQRHQREIQSLRESAGTPGATPKSALQEQIDRLADEVDSMKAKLPAATAKPAVRLVDLSVNALAAGGWSDKDDETIQALQAGGHDPKKRGFNVQNVELVMTGAVDPYVAAQTNIVMLIDEEGETVVELEEAWMQTTSLGGGFQAKAGHFYMPFGRHNPTHPHSWDFVDVPVVNGRIFGPDGARAPGAQLSWLGGDVPLELTAALQNANGETMVSFLGTEEEDPPAGAFVERTVRSPHDLVATARAALSFDISETVPVLLGASYAAGPSGASDEGSTSVRGADLTVKWKPLDAEAGFPFVSFRGEWIARDYEFDDAAGRDTLDDGGWYAQTTWGFMRNWTVGARYDSFSGDFDTVSGLDDRTRWSAALTYYTSEFAKLRLQVNRDDADALDGTTTSVWLQVEFNLGQHGAHKF